MNEIPKIAVVVPCYRVKDQVLNVLSAMPENVWRIYCVDDACPDGSGKLIQAESKDTRVKTLFHETNQGVGGAVITGYKQALEDGADIVVKIDGDGQMDPALIDAFTAPVIEGACDYTKGNRFYNVEDVKTMPPLRLAGNAALSFMTKLSSGYWNVFDPTNGYTAIRADVLKVLPLEKLDKRYFFESDILFRLNVLRAVVRDVPMRAIYAEEESNLKISRILLPFFAGHMRNFTKRIFYNYFLRDFSIASVELLLGLVLLPFGLIFGALEWSHSTALGVPASAGTVMLSALPVIIGVQFLLSFLHYDIAAVPQNRLKYA
ncbi:MAG: glycosyltransferase family 2 protein [Alphaproteobacteria bacterium]